jgi:hypothetical protein
MGRAGMETYKPTLTRQFCSPQRFKRCSKIEEDFTTLRKRVWGKGEEGRPTKYHGVAKVSFCLSVLKVFFVRNTNDE